MIGGLSHLLFHGLCDSVLSGQMFILMIMNSPMYIIYTILPHTLADLIMKGWILEIIILCTSINEYNSGRIPFNKITDIILCRSVIHHVVAMPYMTMAYVIQSRFAVILLLLLWLKIAILAPVVMIYTLMGVRTPLPGYPSYTGNTKHTVQELLYLRGYGFIHTAIIHVIPNRGDIILLSVLFMMVDHKMRNYSIWRSMREGLEQEPEPEPEIEQEIEQEQEH